MVERVQLATLASLLVEANPPAHFQDIAQLGRALVLGTRSRRFESCYPDVMTQPTHVPVAGLLVPIQLVPRIVAAFRATYPTLTEGLEDDPAVRAVLKHFVTSILAQHEATLPVIEAREQIEEIESTVAERQEQARLKAHADAAKISENPANPK